MITKKFVAISVASLMLLSMVLVFSTVNVSATGPTTLPTGKITSPKDGVVIAANQPFTIAYSLSPGSEDYRWSVQVQNYGALELSDVTGRGSIQYTNPTSDGTYAMTLFRQDPQAETWHVASNSISVTFVSGEPSNLPTGKIISPKGGAYLPLQQSWTLKYSLSPGSVNYDWYIRVLTLGPVYKLTDVLGSGTFQVPGEIMQGPGYYEVELCRADPGSNVLTTVDYMLIYGDPSL